MNSDNSEIKFKFKFDENKTKNRIKWKLKSKSNEMITEHVGWNNFRTPNPNNENGFLPIESEKMNFLDVTNDGLVPGVNPNRKAIELWARIEQQVHEINAKSLKSSRDEL